MIEEFDRRPGGPWDKPRKITQTARSRTPKDTSAIWVLSQVVNPDVMVVQAVEIGREQIGGPCLVGSER